MREITFGQKKLDFLIFLFYQEFWVDEGTQNFQTVSVRNLISVKIKLKY